MPLAPPTVARTYPFGLSKTTFVHYPQHPVKSGDIHCYIFHPSRFLHPPYTCNRITKATPWHVKKEFAPIAKSYATFPVDESPSGIWTPLIFNEKLPRSGRLASLRSSYTKNYKFTKYSHFVLRYLNESREHFTCMTSVKVVLKLTIFFILKNVEIDGVAVYINFTQLLLLYAYCCCLSGFSDWRFVKSNTVHV